MIRHLLIISVLFLSVEAIAHCPLSRDAKTLVEESVTRNTLETKWILTQSHPGQSRAFAKNLVGSSNSHVGSLTLAESCVGSTTYEQYCEPACETSASRCNLQRCSQLGCERAGVDTIKLWWQPAPIRYTTDSTTMPKFNVTYRLRPTTKLRFDDRIPGKLLVSWKATDTVSAKRISGTTRLNANGSLVASGVSTTQNPLGGDVSIQYPYLSSSGRTKISLDLNSHGEVSGNVSVNGSRVAKISQGTYGDQVAVIEWLGSCN